MFTPFFRGFHVHGTLLDLAEEPALDEETHVRDTIVLEGGMSAVAHIACEPRRWRALVEIALADAYGEGHFEPAPGIDPFDPDLTAERELRIMLEGFARAKEPYWHGFHNLITSTPFRIELARRAYREYYDSTQAGEDTAALQGRYKRLLAEFYPDPLQLPNLPDNRG